MLYKNRAKTDSLPVFQLNGKKKSMEKAFQCKSNGKYYQFLNYYFKLRFMLTVLLLCFLDSILEANKHSGADIVLNISSASLHLPSYSQK